MKQPTLFMKNPAMGWLVVAVSALFSATLQAQSPVAFEVVSIKRTPPGANGGGFKNGPRQFTTKNYAIRSLFYLAYAKSGYQISGLPAWTETERYDIIAKRPEGTFTPQQNALMIRAMLEDRFKLKAHAETRETPIYALAPNRSDKRPGPQLQPSTLDCVAIRAKRRNEGARFVTPESMVECGFLSSALADSNRRLRAHGVSLAELAAMLGSSGGLDRPVFDRTELPGGFDIDLTFLPQSSGASTTPTDAQSIFSALQDQLGLRLEAAKAPLEILVVDAIERPSDN